MVDKDCHPKDASEQLNPVAAEFKLPCDAVNAPASCKRGSHYEQHGAPDAEKEVQSHVPLGDSICCFTSDDEEMAQMPTKKCKRPFREINLDSKAAEHGSLEDQRRRNSGPPQTRNLHALQMEQGKSMNRVGMQPVSGFPSTLILPRAQTSKKKSVRLLERMTQRMTQSSS